MDHLVEFRLIELAGGHFALQFADLLFGANDPVLIAAPGKDHGLYVLQVVPNSVEHMLPPVLVRIKAFPVMMPLVVVAILLRDCLRRAIENNNNPAPATIVE